MAVCFPVLMCFTGQNGLLANPMGGEVINGQASFATSGNTLTVTNTPGAIINWQGFSINANEVTHFAQQSAASAVLNRVVTNNPSVILGTLSSNGQVFLVNPGGIVFGAGSTVDVAGLVATSLNLSDADFLAGRHNFTNQPGAQNISNAGSINAQQGGQIYLIAPNVENTGIITAPNGEILLAAGHEVQLVNSLDPGLRVSITAPAGDATNLGRLIVESGSLGLFGTVVKNTGTASADSATMRGGKIVFKASQRAEVGGTASANGTTGGTIQALGNEVGIMDGATISADGTQSGGTVLIGGDYQGKNPDVQNAQVTYVAPTATISSDGGIPSVLSPQSSVLGFGNGGKVIVWADDTARIYGSISATGGAVGGNGGFVETSGKRYLDVTSAPNVSAPAGRGGQWLLDPRNVTIQVGPGTMDNIDVLAPYFIPAAADNSTLDVAVINAALNAETSIEVNTGGTGIQLGTITVAAPITKTAGVGAGTLILTAANEILINADITASSGQIQFFTGATQVDVNANITLNGGSWDATGGGATVRVDSGAPIINSPLYTGTVNVSAGTATFNGNIFPTNLTVSGGTLTGTGAITIPNTGAFNWTGNSVIAGSGTLTTQAGSTTTLMPGFAQTVALRGSRVWDNSGVVTFTPNAGTLSFFQIDDTTADGTAVFNNLAGAQFNINASFSDTHTIGVGTFNNAGILNKNLNGTAQSSRINPVFNNQSTGVVNVISGTLTFGGTGIDVAGSTYNVPLGSTLNFGASRTVAGSIAGAGSVGLYNSGGVVGIGISGSYNVSGATSAWADCCGNTTISFTGPVTNIGTTFTGSANSTVDFSGITSGEGTAFANLTNINSSSTLTFKTGTVLSGLTALTVGGGILDLANSSLSLATLDVTGGTLTGSGNIDVSGAFNWTGNSAIAGSGTLTTLVGGTTALAPNFNQTTYLVGSRIWNNYGTVTLTTNATGLSHFQIDDTLTGGTAVFNNMSGGVFNLNGTLNTNHITGVGTFNNAGILNKNVNVSSSFAPVFNNEATGVLNVTSGTLALNGIGTDIVGSAYNIASGTTLQFGASRTVPGSIVGAGNMSFAGGTTTVSGSYNVSGSTQISGTTTATFTGPVTNVGTSIVANSGTTTLNFAGIASGEATAFANLTSINSNSTLTFKTGTVLSGLTALTVGGGILDLANSSLSLATLDVTGGTLTGSGNIDVSGAFNWTGNSAIAGSGTLTTLVGGTTALAPNFNQTTYLVGSRIWNNYGTVTFTPNAGTLSHFQIDDTLTGGTAVFNNMSGGVFNLNTPVSDTHINGVGTFNNAGTLNKNLNFTSSFSPVFNNQSTGVVNVISGTLALNGIGTDIAGSAYNIASGTTLQFGASRTVPGSIAGAGALNITAGTINLDNAVATNLTALNLIGGTLGGTSNVVLGAGSNFNWTGGTITGHLTTQGTTSIPSGTITLGASALWDNSGIATIASSGWGYIGTNAILNNSGSIDIGGNFGTNFNGASGGQFNNLAAGVITLSGTWSAPITGAGGTFSNAGTLTKTTATAQTITNLSNTGIVNVNSGTLAVAGALTQSGLIEVAAGATFSKAGGFSNSINGTLAGVGTISVGIGNSLGNNGTISPGMTVGDMTGTLSIVGNLSMGASSILNIDINSPLAGDYDVLSLTPGMAGNLAGTLNFSGVAPAGSYSIFSSTGGMFGTFATVNSGTFTQTPTYDTGNQLVTLTVTANTNVATAYWTGIAADFNWATAGNWSSGIAPIAGDKVYIGGGAGTVSYTPTAGQVGTIISDGALNFVAGDLTVANASTFRGAVSFNGSTLALTGGGTFGSVSVDSGTSTLTGIVSANSLNVNAGSLILGGASTVNNMNMAGGTLTDNFGLAINGAFNWSGGTITSATGSIFTTSGATATTITGNATMVDNIWQNAGTVNFNGTGNLSLGGAGVAATIFTNQAGGVVNLNGSSTTPIQWAATATNKSFSNAGTLSKNGSSAATQTLDLLSGNTGTVKVQPGILVLPNFTTNDGTISVASGATFSSGSFTNGVTSVLEGAGAIVVGAGTITNNGIIAPGVVGGDTTGTLSITGNVLMGATGQLNFDLNGVSAGNYDVLVISGTADITTANINLKGFGDTGTYTVLTTGGLTGTGTINPGYLTQIPTYTASNLSLGVTGNSLVNAIFWDGGAGTYNWADALNWSANVLPIATDNVYIATLGANSLLINSGAGLGNNFVCDANFQLTGGGLTLGGTSYFNGTTSLSGGTLSTAGATQMGTLNWIGGTITGAGVVDVSSLNMPAGTAVNGVNATSLNGKTMNVNGNTSFSSGAANGNNGADLTLLNGAIINNKLIWSADNIANIIAGTGGGTFNNFGEMRIGQNSATTATISTVFNSDNLTFPLLDLIYGARIINGNLIIAGGGTSIFNAFNTQAGTTIEFTNGYNFNVGGNFGLGDLILSGGQVNSVSTLRAVNITVAGAVTSSGTLSLAANNNILLAAGSSLSSSSGALNINLYSDFDGATGGGIYLDTGSSINSNGGNISMGGMPSTGYAIGNGTVTGGKIFNSGIYVLGDITAGAGNVTMRGEGRAFGSGSNHLADGITFAGGLLSSNGAVSIDGRAHVLSASTAGTDVTAGVDFLGGGTRLSTQTGTVTVTGLNDAGAGFCRAQGITVETGTIIETTGIGTLTLNGTSTGFDTGWGVGIFGGTVRTTAAGGGAITLNGINVTNPDGGVVISDGNVLSSGGEIRIIGAGLGGSGTLGVSTIGGASSGNILIMANDSGPIGFNTTSSINAGSNTLTLMLAGGSITDNGSSMISAGSLRLLGTGTFNLGGSGNNVGTLAANVTGVVNYNDANGFAIGSITSFDGTGVTTTTGVTTGNSNFTGTTVAGNITLNAGASVNAGTGAVILAAGGNFINNSGSAAPITAASGKIYSTSPSSNTKGGMVPAFSIFNCTYLGACGAIPPAGVGFLYTQVTAPILTLIADAVAKVYGDADPALTYVVSGLVGDDLASIVTGAQSRAVGENVGTYAISQGTLSAGGYGYTLSYTGNNLTITPAFLALNISANNASKTYGTTLTFAGTEFTPVGLVGGDTISGVTLTSAGAANTANAGTYLITPSNAVFSVGSAANYSISYVDGTLTVTRVPLAIAADIQTKVYGNTDPSLTYTITAGSLLFSDTLAGGLSRTAGENVGTYAINQGTLGNSNYTVTYTGANFGITPRDITIAVNPVTKTYGQADNLTFAVGNLGLASWDTYAAVSSALTRAAGENVGTYAITQGVLSNTNYNLTGFTGNNLNISAALLTVAGVPTNKVLGTPDPALTYTTSGLQFSDTAATVLNGGSLVRDPGDTIGSYLVNQGTLALLSANYTMTYVPCNFTILAPTVVQEITQMSLQNTPQENTAATATEDTTTAEDEKKQAAQAAAEAEVVADAGGVMAEPLPVCQ